jgi:hypothetical protein
MATNIAVLHYSVKKPEKVKLLAQAFTRGLESPNVAVDLIDGDNEVISVMARYQYIVLIMDTNFWAKMPEKLATFFQRAGMLNGKKCYTYVAKQKVGGKYALNDLIKLAEEHGMKVKNFGLLRSPKTAETTASGCRIE